MFNSLLASSEQAYESIAQLSNTSTILLVILIVVLAILKGYSLWTAAKRGDKWWFSFIFILNLLGILEIIYLFAVIKIWSKKDKKAK